MLRRPKEAPAPFLRRVVAYVIDLIVIFFVIVLPLTGSRFISSADSLYEFTELSAAFSWNDLWTGLVLAVLVILYFALFEYSLRQTLGKMVMRIEVRSMLPRFTFAQALLRNWVKCSNFLLALDVVHLVFSKMHLRYFERLSRTMVVRHEVKR